MNPYKGYTGVVEIDEDSKILVGHVTGIRDTITFRGATVAETIQAFRDSVDDYLAFCAEIGEEPEKPDEADTRIVTVPDRFLSRLAAVLTGAIRHPFRKTVIRVLWACGYRHVPNAETEQALRDVEAGNLTRYADEDEMYRKLGLAVDAGVDQLQSQLDQIMKLKRERDRIIQDVLDRIAADAAIKDVKEHGTVPWDDLKATLGLDSKTERPSHDD